jgi:hypothetical protein
MRDVASTFNDKTTSWPAGWICGDAHVIESSLYGHRLALACLPQGGANDAAPSRLRRLISARANH